MDPFGMQVEASYRKHDYENRAERARLARSIRVPRSEASRSIDRRSLMHSLSHVAQATTWFWRRVGAHRMEAGQHPDPSAGFRPARRRS
ncbi:MAG TPA: hypothetical protein VD789_01040 [Thermomicrobiales bacterium]|nr:hypothetical protein [Thermomicrobiales bacterium]